MEKNNDEKIKRMDIKEFQEKGFLQEANRRFFHPLGLALEIIIGDDEESYSLGGIWDYREDPEGFFFDFANPKFNSPERLVKAKKKKDFVNTLRISKMEKRVKKFGTVIEPIICIDNKGN
jgi:hypothetical protein